MTLIIMIGYKQNTKEDGRPRYLACLPLELGHT